MTYRAELVAAVASRLLHGAGYQAYRSENDRRADDLLVRAKVTELLGAARRDLLAAESEFRRTHLPPPSRGQPRPPPEVMRDARVLEALAGELDALEGRVRALPVFERPRPGQRDGGADAEAMARVAEAMLGHAEMVRAQLERASAQAVLADAGGLRAAMRALVEAIDTRATLA